MQKPKTGFSILPGITAKGAQSSVQVQIQALVALVHDHVALFQVLVFLVQVVVGPGAGLIGAV